METKLNPAALSKINWTQALAVAASFSAVFGMEMTPAQQVAAVLAIQSAQGVLTFLFRTFMTVKK